MNCYADLTSLKSASYLNIASVTTHDTYLRRLLDAASRMIDKECDRFFFVQTETRYYDGKPSGMPLDDILSITTLKLDEDEDATYEATLTEGTDFYLYPYNTFPKWKGIIAPQGGYGTFASGAIRGVQIVGSFGYGDGLSATPYHDAGTDVNDATPMTASQTTCTVDDGTKFAHGQTILIDSEQLFIESIVTHVLTVKRGVNGTTAATHADDSDIDIYDYPEEIREACLIQVMRWWKRKDSAFQDMVGSPELGTFVVAKELDADIKLILKEYRRYR